MHEFTKITILIYIIFKNLESKLFRNPGYAEKLLTSAKQLLEFADRFRKNYHLSVPKVAKFYKSWSGYEALNSK